MVISLVGTPTTANSGTASVTTLDGTVPTGVVDGDLLLWVMSSTNATNPGIPTGWSLWDSQTGTAGSCTIWYRLAVSEPATYTSSGMTSARYAAAMYAFRGVDRTTPKDVAVTKSTGTNTTIVQPPAIVPVTAGAMIWCVEHGTTTAGTTGTFATSNMNLGHTTASSSGSLSNAQSGAGYLLQTTPASFTGAFTSTSTFQRAIAFSSALRPALRVRANVFTSDAASNRSRTW